MLLDGPSRQLHQRGQAEVRAATHKTTRPEGVAKQIQGLQRQPGKRGRQSGKLVVTGREKLERGHFTKRPRQRAELVAVQLELYEGLEEGEGGRKSGEAVPSEVQESQTASQGPVAKDAGELGEFVSGQSQLK